jgi:predicted DNA binding CopG/RHH family protein
VTKKTHQQRWAEKHPEIVAKSKQQYEAKFERITLRIAKENKENADWLRSQSKAQGISISEVINQLIEEARERTN